MSKYSKWIYAGIGWAIFGPIGALIGYYIGNNDNDSETSNGPHRGRYHNTGSIKDLHMALMVLLAAVIKADGMVRNTEMAHARKFIENNYDGDKASEMFTLLQDLIYQDIPLADVCVQIKQNTDYDTRYHMFDFLYSLAVSDNELHDNEILVLHHIAVWLGINQQDYSSIYSRYSSAYSGGYQYAGGYQSNTNRGLKRDPYKVLGLDSTATLDEVRKAYRRLAMKYHPDKVAMMDEEIQKNAEKQFREINEAYEEIMKRQ